MKRRTLLQWFVGFVAARPFLSVRLFAQAPPFSAANKATLAAIAEVVLPTSLGDSGRAAVVDKFVAWFVNYRAGSDMGHTYGSPDDGSRPSRIANKSAASPVSRYATQFAAFDATARDRGAASFAAWSPAERQSAIEVALTTNGQAARLPARPNGTNLVADFMGFYFNSGDAYDLCYNAAIGRENCRSLDGSDQPPTPIGGGH